MSTVTWLHLSDWHQGRPNLDRSMVFKALVADLRNRAKINGRLRKIDFVVFSGDLAFSGRPEEYDTVEREFLTPVAEAVEVPAERWFMVPGNHDVDRGKLKYLPSAALKIKNREELNQNLSDEDFVDGLTKPTKAYSACCERFLGKWGAGTYSYAVARKLDVNGTSVGLAGLNSAMLCGLHKEDDEVQDYGWLVLGEHQIEKALSAIQDAELRIGVVHHPFGWMSPLEGRNRTERRLIRDCHFILRGHEHESQVEIPSGTAGNCAVISAGAAYGGRDYPVGYNFVDIDYSQQQATVYLRRYVDAGNRFDPDTDVTGFETPGYSSFVLPKITGKPQMDQGSKQSPEQQMTAAAKADPGAAHPRATSVSVSGDPWAAQNPALLQTLGEVYQAQHARVLFEYVYSSFRVQANCLLREGEAGYGEPDVVQTVKVFRAGTEALHCFKVNVVVVPPSGAKEGEESPQFLGQIDLEFEDQGGGETGLIVAPARTVNLPGSRELLLFFDPVLKPGSGPYRLTVNWKVRGSLDPLKGGRDELFLNPTRAAGSVGGIDLVAHIPESFGAVSMEESRRQEALAGGVVMDAAALAEFPAPAGFRTLGWRGRDLRGLGPFAVDLVKG